MNNLNQTDHIFIFGLFKSSFSGPSDSAAC